MKAILLIDEMPKNCRVCPLKTEKDGYLNYCFTGKTLHADVIFANNRLVDCPLKPMPNKKKPNDPDETWEELHHRFGYNDCIDEIFGEQK